AAVIGTGALIAGGSVAMIDKGAPEHRSKPAAVTAISGTVPKPAFRRMQTARGTQKLHDDLLGTDTPTPADWGQAGGQGDPVGSHPGAGDNHAPAAPTGPTGTSDSGSAGG